MRRLLPLRLRTTLVNVAVRARLAAAWREHVNIMVAVPCCLETLKHPKVVGDQRGIIAYLGGASGEHDASCVQHDDVVGKAQRELYVLLDQHNRLSLVL